MKQVSFVRTLQTLALAWLLLLIGGSHSQVLCNETVTSGGKFFCRYPKIQASGDTLVPQITFNKSQIDICKYSTGKDFILTIGFDRPIAKTDSLFIIELSVAFRSDLVQIDGAWPVGTLCEKATELYTYVDNNTGDKEYSVYRIQCANTAIDNPTPLHDTSKTKPSVLINLTGSYIKDTIVCADFLLAEVYFGSEFKPPYKHVLVDTAMLCAKSVYDEANTIEANMLTYDKEDTIELKDLISVVPVDFTMQVANIKNLHSFDVEFELDAETAGNIEFITDAPTASSCSEYKIEPTATGYKLSATVRNIGIEECDGKFPWGWFKVDLKRKNSQYSLNTLHYTVMNINQEACSMNGLSGDMLVLCPEITSINEENLDAILIQQSADRVIIKSHDYILGYEIYDMLGNMVTADNFSIHNGLNTVELNKYNFLKGVYLMKVEASSMNTATQYHYVKLIIN